jgi:tetratricopeptide (TPR) repeat protein
MTDNQKSLTDDAAVEAAFAAGIEALRAKRPLRTPQLLAARKALDSGRPDVAERLLTEFLRKRARDADALNLVGETLMRLERKADAEAVFAQCVERTPGFDLARYNYANALQGMNKPAEAVGHIRMLLDKYPGNPALRELAAVTASAARHYADALAFRAALVRDYPASARLRVSHAQALRTLGRHDESIAAFRSAIEIAPSLGIAWWGLANLKTWRFTGDDVAQMRAEVSRAGLDAQDRTHLLFALGKALGDQARFAESFDAYARANAARRLASGYDPDSTSAQVAKFKALFTPEFFRARAGAGSESTAPIFVLGMQRAGSTLLEQILASHSGVEGAGELAHVRFLARQLESGVAPQYHTDYPGVLGRLDAGAFKALAERYLEETRPRRPLGRPFFVDKEPFNFWHIGFLQLMLPNARIVDIRRHPLGCCWSNFTTIFLHGLPLAWRLGDIGRFYADYVELMAHYDRVLPGKVHRIFYEDLVAEPEREVRRLLDYLGLPFEEACLRFYDNSRAVNSASSEQVRRPIFDDALDWWRNYEPWLGALKAALGPVLASYPDVPE